MRPNVDAIIITFEPERRLVKTLKNLKAKSARFECIAAEQKCTVLNLSKLSKRIQGGIFDTCFYLVGNNKISCWIVHYLVAY